MDMWQDISYLLMHSTRMEEKILEDDYKAVNALAKGEKKIVILDETTCDISTHQGQPRGAERQDLRREGLQRCQSPSLSRSPCAF